MERYITIKDKKGREIEVLASTYCFNCGEDEEKNLRYNATYANGEDWDCLSCNDGRVHTDIEKYEEIEDEEEEIFDYTKFWAFLDSILVQPVPFQLKNQYQGDSDYIVNLQEYIFQNLPKKLRNIDSPCLLLIELAENFANTDFKTYI